VLFERRLQVGLIDGSIRLAFRRWRRAQVVAGRRYRSPIGLIQVERVSVIDGDVPLQDALAAGYARVDDLLADLRGPSDSPIYRLELRVCACPDPRDELADRAALSEPDRGQLEAKLGRLDRGRAWTMATLLAIQERPGTRAGDLAMLLGWSDLHDFKLHVRKLKALGLTLSLRVGYRLSPRGEAYVRRPPRTG
jgi:hypothetical protein